MHPCCKQSFHNQPSVACAAENARWGATFASLLENASINRCSRYLNAYAVFPAPLLQGEEGAIEQSSGASRREIAGEIAARIDAAVRAGHLPAQDTALAATALLGALHESLVGPLAPENIEDPAKLRDAVQTVTLLALRAVGVMDARARGLVVQQTVLPAKALVGA